MKNLRKMMLRAGLAAIPMGLSGSATAAIVVQGFHIAPGSWFGGGNPYGIGADPTFNGTVTLDTNDTSGTTFQAINFVTGSRTWSLADINVAGSSASFFGDVVNSFSLVFGSFAVNNSLYSNNTIALTDDTGFRACNGCVSLTSGVAAVPEPAAWVLMIAGFGLVGSAMRRRAATVSFA
jgi:hypothetical protein